jgi:arylformamidase
MNVFPPGAEIIDVTVPFGPGVPVWPTHPPIVVEPLRRIADGGVSNVTLLAISSHAGTHVDANWHFIDDGARLLDIPLARWSGPCFVARIADQAAAVDVAALEAASIPSGTKRLLLRTRNSREWEGWDGTTALPFREDYVGVTPAAADWIVARGIRLVGHDYLSIGPFGDANQETHTILLGNDVLIVETLDLSRVDPGGYRMICLPLKVAAGDGAPARVLLVRE